MTSSNIVNLKAKPSLLLLLYIMCSLAHTHSQTSTWLFEATSIQPVYVLKRQQTNMSEHDHIKTFFFSK